MLILRHSSLLADFISNFHRPNLPEVRILEYVSNSGVSTQCATLSYLQSKVLDFT